MSGYYPILHSVLQISFGIPNLPTFFDHLQPVLHCTALRNLQVWSAASPLPTTRTAVYSWCPVSCTAQKKSSWTMRMMSTQIHPALESGKLITTWTIQLTVSLPKSRMRSIQLETQARCCQSQECLSFNNTWAPTICMLSRERFPLSFCTMKWIKCNYYFIKKKDSTAL